LTHSIGLPILLFTAAPTAAKEMEMQGNSRIGIAMIAALSALAASAASAADATMGFANLGQEPRSRRRSSPASSIVRGNRCNPAGRYPEQSLRQANRKHRRAQGGPGLDRFNAPRVEA
jgi:hypothetical protein